VSSSPDVASGSVDDAPEESAVSVAAPEVTSRVEGTSSDVPLPSSRPLEETSLGSVEEGTVVGDAVEDGGFVGNGEGAAVELGFGVVGVALGTPVGADVVGGSDNELVSEGSLPQATAKHAKLNTEKGRTLMLRSA
jgi:hypothetical protein